MYERITVYVAASSVTDTHTETQTHKATTVAVVNAPRVNESLSYKTSDALDNYNVHVD